MRPKNILCAGIGFLMVLISAYFGASIHNANSNDIISYLNEMDHIYYYDADLIPSLNLQAALFTLPLVLVIIVIEAIIALKSKVRQVKNIARGLFVAALIVIVMAIITLNDPVTYNFGKWGYVWITMGIFIVAGNAISVFIKGNKGKAL